MAYGFLIRMDLSRSLALSNVKRYRYEEVAKGSETYSDIVKPGQLCSWLVVRRPLGYGEPESDIQLAPF